MACPLPSTRAAASRRIAVLLVAATATPALGAPVQVSDPPEAPDLRALERVDLRVVTEGLVLERWEVEPAAASAPLVVHLLRADRHRFRPEVALALDQVLGQEAPSAMVARRGAAAGVNGGFSVSNDPRNPIHGDPNGFVMIGGEIVSDPVLPRAAAFVCPVPDGSRELILLQPAVEHRLRFGAAEDTLVVIADGVNRARGPDEVVLYTPWFNRTTARPPGGLEIAVAAGTVRTRSSSGSTAVPDDGWVVSAGPGAARRLDGIAEGSTAARATRLTLDPVGGRSGDGGAAVRSLGDVANRRCDATSAGPAVVVGGVPVDTYEEEAFGDHFTLVRHPRTGIGTTADGDWLLVLVDGRSDASSGVTLPELAEIFVRFGAELAYNLDGGGSSAMVVGDEIVNTPSDGRERRRSDGVLLMAIPDSVPPV